LIGNHVDSIEKLKRGALALGEDAFVPKSNCTKAGCESVARPRKHHFPITADASGTQPQEASFW
jgi:hypothetical protein